jgi:thiol-disulfide isomerase/thioredoxin
MYARLAKLGLVVLLASCAACSGNDVTSHARELLAHSRSFPFDFRLPDPDGKQVSLADYKGKIVIVDFWGTWCPPCRDELPHLVELYGKYHASGLEIVGINYERVSGDQARQIIRDFITEHHIPYRCVMGDQETEFMVPAFDGYPTTLFIDRSGKVRLVLRGYTSQAVLEAVAKILLEEPTY